MTWSRRSMMLAGLGGLGLFAVGCTEKRTDLLAPRPEPDWPRVPTRPTTTAYDRAIALPPKPHVLTARPQSAAPVSSRRDPLNARPRSRWTRAGAVAGRVNPMNGVQRITVHHEGWHAVWFDDERRTAAHLSTIRNIHVRDRGWGDIGYHYIIDRAGVVWQGRDARYQGAHVKNNNEHNLGILVLGNFEKQVPTTQQLNVLHRSLRALTAHYRVPVRRVYTHRELNPSQCPGRHLQPRVAALRSSGALA